MSAPDPSAGPSGVAGLVGEARSGGRRATARLLSMVERGGAGSEEVALGTLPHAGSAHVVGVTGAPGSGKSTITGALTLLLAEGGGRPAVLAVDPSSPLTGGAILGDRVRMDEAAAAGVFIRSMATRGHLGGLALAVHGAVRVLDACGFDPVVVETVGVGQVEVDVAGAADTTVVVVAPGWGDAVQANKAGLLEIADLFVVNKADRPGADDARRDLDLMLDLSAITGSAARARPPIVMNTATEGAGIAELATAVADHRIVLDADGGLGHRRERRRQAEVRAHLDHALAAAAHRVVAGDSTAGEEAPVVTARRLAGRLLAGDQGTAPLLQGE